MSWYMAGRMTTKDRRGVEDKIQNKKGIMDTRIIDSHLHLDLVYTNFPDRIGWMQEHGVVPISWAFCPGVKDRSGLLNCLAAQAGLVRNLNRKGMTCFYLAGIHPRNIPPDLAAGEAEDILAPYLEDPLCLGMGEIGLETGSDIEQEILRAQLALGKRLIAMDKRIGIHTPRENKPAVTAQTMALLADFPEITPVTVIDHCTPETIGRVLEAGFHAGITLSPIKTSLDDLRRIVDGQAGQHDAARPNRIMCNTDSGVMFYENLVDFCNDERFPADLKRALAFENANGFFVHSFFTNNPARFKSTR